MVCKIIAEDIIYVRKISIVRGRVLEEDRIINVTIDLC